MNKTHQAADFIAGHKNELSLKNALVGAAIIEECRLLL